MRRKLVVLSLLLVATVSAAGAKTRARTHIQMKDICWSCGYCIDGTCYDCVQIICPAGGGQ